MFGRLEPTAGCSVNGRRKERVGVGDVFEH